MKDISNLIKEARPLYFAKKKRNEQIKKFVIAAFILFSTSISALGGYGVREAQINQDKQIVSLETSDDIISLYPVDEYGLITVNY